MLKILSMHKMPNHLKYIQVPWDKYFKENKVTKYLDSSDEEIIREIESTALLNNETIQGKFSEMPIGIGCLSEGCKTLLCINHAIKTKTIQQYIFNITSCGGNAISYLAGVIAKDIDIYVTVNHSDFGISNNVYIQIDDGEVINNAIQASDIHIKINKEI